MWNVLGGMSSAIVAVLVPPFLTRLLPPEAYGAWAIALQIGTYVNLFGMGVQIAVGRYVAFHHQPEATAERDAIVASAFWCILIAAIIGILIIGCVALNTDRLFPQLSPVWRADSALATGLLGLSFGIGLLGSVFGSVFLGLQKSHVPAMTQMVGRVAQAILLIAAAQTRSLTIMAIAHLIGSIGICSVLIYLWSTRTAKPTIAPKLVSRKSLKALADFCVTLTVWNLAMLLVSGLDLIIISRYDFGSVPYYAVSLTLVSFITGTLQSMAGALPPAAATMQSTGDQRQLHDLFLRSTSLMAVAALLVSAPLMFLGQGILHLWVGEVYADNAYYILALLAVANVIRTCLLPYGMIAIGTGQQRRMLYTPLIEGVVSLALSLWWGSLFGAIGVAAAKIVSAGIGIALLLAQHALSYTMPDLHRREVAFVGMVRPAIFWLFLGGTVLLLGPFAENMVAYYPAIAIAILAAAIAMGWRELVAAIDYIRSRKTTHA
nr:oligosaccharide flippase family protein [Sphingomonas sp. CFBP 13728]